MHDMKSSACNNIRDQSVNILENISDMRNNESFLRWHHQHLDPGSSSSS